MKYVSKLLMCSAALTALFLTSCAKEIEGPQLQKSNVISVSISAEADVPKNLTKTTFEGENLVWTGDETASVLIGNTASADNTLGKNVTLPTETPGLFKGSIDLGTFSVADMRAVTVPGNSSAWIEGSADNAFTAHLPLSISQTQASDGVMNGSNFPLYAALPQRNATSDGVYTIGGLNLKWGCAAIMFNVFGSHPQMNDESLVSITVKYDDHFPTDIAIKLDSDQILKGGADAQTTTVTLTAPASLNGRTQASGAKVYMAIYPGANSVREVRIVTDKAVYTLAGTDAPLYSFTETDGRGTVHSAGLDLSKFTRKVIDSGLNVALVRATDSTIAVGWTCNPAYVPFLTDFDLNPSVDYSAEVSKKYTAAIYKDAACKELHLSVAGVTFEADKPLVPLRYIFPGLEPNTTYYVKVTNTTDGKSNSTPLEVKTTAMLADPASVVTSNAAEGDLVAFHNFSRLQYGGDMTSRAAGVSHSKRSSQTAYPNGGLTGSITWGSNNYIATTATTEIGLFDTLDGFIDDHGLTEWGWQGGAKDTDGGNMCARPGYVKLGITNDRAFICTPALNAIPEGKLATLRVVFNAAPYGGYSSNNVIEAERYMAVKAFTSATLEKYNKMSYKAVAAEEYLTLEGNRISDWKEYTVQLKGVPSGSSVAIGGALDAATTNRMFVDDIRVYVESYEDAPASPLAKGTVKYSDGTPAAGVSVTDGFTVVQTDAQGNYSITPNKDAWYIYYTVPSDCEVAINNYGQPAFFTKYIKERTSYDFTLTKRNGGKETNFTLFCLADPQCKDATHRGRFLNESVPEIKAHAATKIAPCYGVTLGDIVYSEGTRNCEGQMEPMRSHMAKDLIGMPVFQVMGNHDYTYFHTNAPISADETSSTYNMKIQRAFENVFGPIDYSWDRGDVHIVCMRNMQWTSNTSSSNYSLEFSDDQYKWLQQDLSFVPKDKMVILCVHVPLVNSSNKNIQNVINLLKEFKEAHIMSGHTHYMRNEPTLNGGVFEHIHAAVSGAWWFSNINGDGSPNGYGVYDIEGTTITNWYYKGINGVMSDRDYQIRLYRGGSKFGGTHEKFMFPQNDDVLLANVFNYDPSWTIKVYENGIYSGDMTLIPSTSDVPAVGTEFTVSTTDSSKDWWAIGYHVGVVGRGHSGGTRKNYITGCRHMFTYTLKDKTATVKVEATDRFGRVYSASTITEDYDYSLMAK